MVCAEQHGWFTNNVSADGYFEGEIILRLLMKNEKTFGRDKIDSLLNEYDRLVKTEPRRLSELRRRLEDYKEGNLEAGGKRYAFKYKKYDKPIVITNDFRWKKDLTKSPLDTMLTQASIMRRAERLEDLYALSTDPDRLRSQVLRNIKGKYSSPKDYYAWRNQRYSLEAILGEILYGDITIVVKKYEIKGFPDHTTYLGYPVVKKGDKYLIDIWAVESDTFLQRLSADNYSCVTGVKGPR
jgi:hypothetical protein